VNDDATIIDFDVTHAGDDVCLLMVHRRGSNGAAIHELESSSFRESLDALQEEFEIR
jgi:fructose 1,6-bisphosphatase